MKFYFCFSLFSMLFAQAVPDSDKMYKAEIICQKNSGNQLLINLLCYNNTTTTQRIRYDVLVQKQGSGGSSTNHQNGWATIAPSRSNMLSQVQLGVQATDTYTIRLQLFNLQGQLLAQDSLQTTPTSR